MRTTVTLDDDVAARVQQRQREAGASFKETINEILREGLLAHDRRQVSTRFQVRPLGPGVHWEFESTSALLEELEGSEE